MKTPNEIKLLRLKEVLARTGLSRTTVYRKLTAKTFPAPVALGANAIAWRSNEIDAWIAALSPKSPSSSGEV